MFHPLVGFTFKQLPVRIMGVCFCVLCPLKSLQDTLLWWRWAQIFTSAASASSSIIISRSFSPISKMDAPYPALTHQPPLQRQFLQVKTPYIVVSLHAKKKNGFTVMHWLHVIILVLHRFQRRVCLRGNLPDLRHERCQKDSDQSAENTFQKIKTFADFKETHLLFLRSVPLAVLWLLTHSFLLVLRSEERAGLPVPGQGPCD